MGAEVPESRICHTLEDARAAAAELGFPVVVRPSFTLGGTGSGIARTRPSWTAWLARAWTRAR